VEIVIFWLIMGGIVAVIANSKGLDVGQWFLYGSCSGLNLPLETRKGAHFWTPLDLLRTLESGGAGIRTPVREKIDHSVYVRVPLIEVSSRWPMDSPLLDKFPKFSPAAGKRDD
jgi:hypothetical protein